MNIKRNNKLLDNYSQSNGKKITDNKLINNNLKVLNTKSNLRNHSQNKNNIKGDLFNELLGSQESRTSNMDIENNYKIKMTEMEKIKAQKDIDRTIKPVPYKPIIKDRIMSEHLAVGKEKELIVHKSDKNTDANMNKFTKELTIRNIDRNKLDTKLKIEFNVKNQNRHENKFAEATAYAKAISPETATFSDKKGGSIDYYKQRQQEREKNLKLCELILSVTQNTQVMNESELPTNNMDEI
jgi:hypothetical protein